MKRLILILAAMALLMATASSVDAAPKPTPDGVNHPAFPQECIGDPDSKLGEHFFGWAIIANGGAVANGTLPTGFIYEGGDFFTPPDFSEGDPILGVSMYRRTVVLDGETVLSDTGQGRSSGNGNKAPDEGFEAIEEAIERVESKWTVNICSVAIPGFLLAELYPDADPPYVPTYTYLIINWLK